jgi:hypothetical protein
MFEFLVGAYIFFDIVLLIMGIWAFLFYWLETVKTRDRYDRTEYNTAKVRLTMAVAATVTVASILMLGPVALIPILSFAAFKFWRFTDEEA